MKISTKILEIVRKNKCFGGTQRHGQAVFNVLYEKYPYIAGKFRATDVDPFYNDELIEEFLEKADELNCEMLSQGINHGND